MRACEPTAAPRPPRPRPRPRPRSRPSPGAAQKLGARTIKQWRSWQRATRACTRPQPFIMGEPSTSGRATSSSSPTQNVARRGCRPSRTFCGAATKMILARSARSCPGTSLRWTAARTATTSRSGRRGSSSRTRHMIKSPRAVDISTYQGSRPTRSCRSTSFCRRTCTRRPCRSRPSARACSGASRTAAASGPTSAAGGRGAATRTSAGSATRRCGRTPSARSRASRGSWACRTTRRRSRASRRGRRWRRCARPGPSTTTTSSSTASSRVEIKCGGAS